MNPMNKRDRVLLSKCLMMILVLCLIGCEQEAEVNIEENSDFEKIQLSSDFFAEGVAIGDLNGDGQPDIAAGPYWYVGPGFEQRHEFYEPVAFDPLEYSENFIVEIEDVNGDEMADILIVGFPGESAHWYENPGSTDEHWERHLIHESVDNESPRFYDFNKDGQLELIFHTEGVLGFASRNESDSTAPWEFTPISEEWEWGAFTHGLGIGDIDGDGLEDVIKKEGWWKTPGIDSLDSIWEFNEVDFGVGDVGGAQMYVYDVDDDGYNDVITSLNAHGWGLAWYRQVQEGENINFEKNLIMGDSPDQNEYGVAFAELHSINLVDMDGDGIKDLITGKRWWAHGPDGEDFQRNPAVLYWFELERTGEGVTFIPHQIDNASGVGVEVDTEDLNGDGKPDIAISNKKGTFVFLNQL